MDETDNMDALSIARNTLHHIATKLQGLANTTDDLFWAVDAIHAGHPRAKAMARNAFAVANEVATTPWIPVSDRLPEPFAPVLLWCRFSGRTDCSCEGYLAIRDPVPHWEIANLEYGSPMHVTHWMPMPIGPTTGEG